MGERFSRAEQLEHRVQMLLGIFSAKGVLPLEFKPAYSVGNLLTQYLDELEQETKRKGGIPQSRALFRAPHGVSTAILLAQLDHERLHGLLIAEDG
jgi:hypothetical protein